MSPRRLCTIAATVPLVLIALTGCENRPQPKVVKLATVLPRSHPSGAALLVLRDRLQTLSGGQMTADIAFDSVLGGAQEALAKCQDGELDMAHLSIANLGNIVYTANVLAMPFLWRDSAHQHRALDNQIGEILKKEAPPYDFEILGFLDAGTRNLVTRSGPVSRPADLEGMRIRVMDSPLMADTLSALGANPFPLEQSKVYAALKAGEIDGWENNALTVMAFKTHETGCTWYARTQHFSIPDVVIAGRAFLAGLTAEQRRWLDQAVQETVERQRQIWQQSERQVMQEMADKGMQVTDVDLEAFRESVQPVYDRYYATHGESFKGLVEQIRSLAEGPSSAPATRAVTAVQ